MTTLRGYDLDSTLRGDEDLDGCVVISGRTWAEYDDRCKAIAQRCPLYIRGFGAYGDRFAAAFFKATMIRGLGVTEFFEDDLWQAEIIRQQVPTCTVHVVEPVG